MVEQRRHRGLFMMAVAAARHDLSLIARDTPEYDRVLQVWVDGTERGEIAVSPYVSLGAAFADSHVAVWGGMDFYIAPLSAGSFRLIEYDDFIHVAYPESDYWCIVAELSVALFDLADGHTLARHDHDEILTASRWLDDKLVVTDFQGRSLTFRLLTMPPGLQRDLDE